MQSTTVSTFPRLQSSLQRELLDGYDGLIARLAWDRPRIRRHQRRRLQDLLHHAAAHSPFHADRLAGIDLDAVEPDDLSALPVMTKSELMADFDRIVTDPGISLAGAEDALAAAVETPAVIGDDVLVLTSGGTSGTRGVFLLGLAAQRQFYGSLTRSLVARLRATGTPPGGLSVAMVGAGSPVHATGTAPPLTCGSALPFHFTAVPVTRPVAEIVDRLNRLQPHAVFGYPTVLARLADEQRTGRLHITPGTVTCTSETLTRELRERIRTGFAVPVIDSFGSSEGLVGVAGPDDDVIVFAEDGCIVELVDADDRPVPPGTPSQAVLVTVLENGVQPLIRYRIGDSFVEQPSAPAHGYLRARVQGRSDDELRFGDVVLHPLVVRSVLAHAPAVLDYQVRQTGSGIAVRLLAPHGAAVEPLHLELTRALAGAGLAEPQVSVAVVDDLPRDPLTGKLRRFLPLP